MPKVGGGCPSLAALAPARLAGVPSSPPKVQEIRSEEATKKAAEVSGKPPTEEMPGPRKKAKVTGRRKYRREGEGSKSRAARGKGPANLVDEAPVPRTRPKSVRELCSARFGVDNKDYHVVRMSSLPEQDPDAPLELHLSPLTHDSRIWQDGAASTKYVWEVQIPRLATDLYTLPSEVLIDRAAKIMVSVELEEATRRRQSLEIELSEVKDLLGDLQNQLNDARELLGVSQSQLKDVRARGRRMEDELLNLTRNTEALKVDLPKEAVADYKKSVGFKMGLVRTGQVSYEYGYQVALARFRFRYLELEVEEDPFKNLLEDLTVPMEADQPFDYSLPSPEE
ncbi:hypothetical protein BHM03_00031752 [Ensete ventricosum]|uniref:Uncharacterized protein n=1 Tax=Ensete ventricosum TaxID=4639 RepID=A0A445MIQ0_ENSVE|nr:hypothetical protein BHM03_00031752 [Ensete ventricosum]